MSSETSADVDVIIPTFNACDMVARCVERLVTAPSVARVFVVDDASTDGTFEALAERFPSVRTIRLSEQRGLAHAFNAGAAAGSAEFVLFLNNDIFAAPDAVSRLVAALRDDPGASSAAGRLVDPGTMHTQTAYQPRELPGLAGLLVRIAGIERVWPGNPWTGQFLTAPLSEAATQRTRRQPAGACILVRRDMLARIGGGTSDTGCGTRTWTSHAGCSLMVPRSTSRRPSSSMSELPARPRGTRPSSMSVSTTGPWCMHNVTSHRCGRSCSES